MFNSQGQDRRRSQSWSLLTYILFFCFILFFVDSKTQVVRPVHGLLAYLTGAIREVAVLPQEALDVYDSRFKSYQSLVRERDELLDSRQKLKTSLLQMATLKAENIRLRELLNSTKVLPAHYTAAEIIRVNHLSKNQEVLINRGKQQNVKLKQAVLDSSGLIGHVVEVFPFQSRILLISDRRHRVPVQIIRNGYRGIVSGTGSSTSLEMKIPKKIDTIKKGDLLVTTGLGGLYPPGYPVGTVERLEEINSAFMKAVITPSAHLSSSSHVLLTTHDPQDDVLSNEVESTDNTDADKLTEQGSSDKEESEQ